ncbi:MAG: isoaspartyl peptidase/L-asparaginase [Bacteroidetes bacterium]|nr:isoaspartyl peptidase/L-asparaginase [Bacteroidota bacterium]
MKKHFLVLFLFCFTISNAQESKYAIIIHGGAGNGLVPGNYNEVQTAAFHHALNAALARGDSALAAGADALDVVSLVIQVLENDSLFNAGKGAVLTYEAKASLDASIMDGASLEAGAVAGVSCIKNPITAALSVLRHSPHVILSGAGADRYAQEKGSICVDPSYFIIPSKLKTIKRIRKEQEALDSAQNHKMGTVGCVVRDREGNIAAGTSTGGMMAKRYGRIGDSPIVGAGTYANNSSAGISCTGHGEYFIRNVIAFQVANRVDLIEESGQEAADYMIHDVLSSQKAFGGLIGIDRNGELFYSFNTTGMLRGFKREGEKAQTYIFSLEIEGDN